jgi:hypothetical protein
MAESKGIASGPVSTGGISHRPMFAVGAVLLGAFLANFDSRLFTIIQPGLPPHSDCAACSAFQACSMRWSRC